MKALSPVDVARQYSAYLYDWIDDLSPKKNQWMLRARVDRQMQWAIQSGGKVRMVETKRACTQEAQKDRKDRKVLMR